MFGVKKIKSKKKNLSTITIPSLLIIAVLICVFSLTSCSMLGSIGIGKTISEERQVSSIERVSIGSSMNLIIEQSGTESLRIEATENILPYISSEVINGELQIEFSRPGITIRPINCYVSVKDLKSIKVSSSAKVKCDNLKVENLAVNMASSSSGNLNVSVKDLELLIASSASLTISGEAELQNTTVNSSGSLDASDLVTRDCKIKVNSSGEATVNVTDNLDATVNSSAELNYKGNPKVNSDVSSSGEINKIGN